MAEFNPDEYIKAHASASPPPPHAEGAVSAPSATGGFDPDAYIQANETPDVVQEMHPDISSIDRLVIKNLSNSPQAGVNYLKEKLPKHDIRQQGDQIIVRGPNEKKFKVLDPDTGFSPFSDPKEALRDTGDILYDAVSGLGQGAASTAGGLATGAPTGGAGALAGAMGGGAASSAAMEAIRQKLGQYAGLKQDVNPTDVAISGAVGGALPAVGAAASKAWQGAKSTVLPWLGEQVSGTPKEFISQLAEKFPALKAMQQTEGDEMPAVGRLWGKLKDHLGEGKNGAGREVEEGLTNAGQNISIADAKSIFQKARDKVLSNAKEINVEPAKQAFDKAWSSIFQLPVEGEGVDAAGNLIKQTVNKEIEDDLSPRAAIQLQKNLRELAQYGSLKDSSMMSGYGGMSQAEQEVAHAASGAYKSLNEEFEKATGGVSSDLKATYQKWASNQRYAEKFFGSPDKTFSTLSNLDKKAKTPVLSFLKNLDEAHPGLNLLDDAKTIGTYSTFFNPAATAKNQIPLRVLGGGLGSFAGYKAGNDGGGHGGYTGSLVGGIAGQALGGYLGNPAMIKNVIQSYLKSQAFKDAAMQYLPNLPKGTGQGIAKSLWEMGRKR